MAFIEDMFKGNIVTGIAVGVGALIIAPLMIPAARNIVKPLAKAAIKGGIMAFEKGKELVAEGAEVMEDIYAEAVAEIDESRKAASAAAAGATQEV